MNEQEKFERLIQSSELLVRAANERGDDFSILTELYGDPSHFVYEILQNAEDVGATKVEFELFNDRIEIIHNGQRDFIFEDVRGIVRTGNSIKKDDINKLGKFGVGFKSIFAITNEPKIHSGEYHFCIKDLFIPERISPISLTGTKFILPFKHKKRTEKEIYELIKFRLQNIGATFLLFLSNIQEVSWKNGEFYGFYSKKISPVKGLENVWKASIQSEHNSKNYLIFGKSVNFGEKKLFVKIAYQLQGAKIVPISREHFLHAFFETNVRTSLNFLIHAPFRTTPARDNIPFENPDNIRLIESLSDLVAESIEVIRDLGKLSVDFYEKVLPLREPELQGIIYSKFYEKVLKISETKRVLPSSIKNKFVLAENALVAKEKDLVRLLNSKDLKKIFRKSHFLDANITSDKTPNFWRY
ncbi:MAG TPA: hypothetical protein VK892_08045, partial [Pyrinomonadaceae bacterium]|nr:hypothetical protein [Pyrinomonadaceae bacterium]